MAHTSLLHGPQTYEQLTIKQFFFRHTLAESLGRAPLCLRFLSRMAGKFLVFSERSFHPWCLLLFHYGLVLGRHKWVPSFVPSGSPILLFNPRTSLHPPELHNQFEVFVFGVAVSAVQKSAADHFDEAHRAAITNDREVRMHAAI